jgi:hypothetical protein
LFLFSPGEDLLNIWFVVAGRKKNTVPFSPLTFAMPGEKKTPFPFLD